MKKPVLTQSKATWQSPLIRENATSFYCVKKTTGTHTVPVDPKSFRYAKSRRSGKPSSDEGGGFAVGEDGGRETRSEKSLPQSFASQNPAPSSEGACAYHRHAGGYDSLQGPGASYFDDIVLQIHHRFGRSCFVSASGEVRNFYSSTALGDGLLRKIGYGHPGCCVIDVNGHLLTLP